MSKIYIEVPKTTDMITASVPCGKEEDYLWQFSNLLLLGYRLRPRYSVHSCRGWSSSQLEF